MVDKYQIMDKLDREHFAALRESIKKHGVQVAVELDEEGSILDGHNRVEIANKLGIDYPTVVKTFKTEAEKRAYVLMVNLCRRHLNAMQWGRAFSKYLTARGVKQGRGKGNPHAKESKTATVAVLASELGVSERTARDRMARADEADKAERENREPEPRKRKEPSLLDAIKRDIMALSNKERQTLFNWMANL